MKGIILAGGAGTRLNPLTKVTSKQLLPVYNKPMVMYPLDTLLKAGITEILLIVAPERCGDFMKLLGSGKEFGAKFTYEVQDSPRGIADAFLIGERFIGKSDVCLILGDNIFEDDFTETITNFKSGGQVFATEVKDPERFGVVEFDKEGKAIKIVEKPKTHISNYAVTGLYVFDNKCVEIAKNLKPSDRGELEVTDISSWYLENSELSVQTFKGHWFDAGTFDSLLAASQMIQKKIAPEN